MSSFDPPDYLCYVVHVYLFVVFFLSFLKRNLMNLTFSDVIKFFFSGCKQTKNTSIYSMNFICLSIYIYFVICVYFMQGRYYLEANEPLTKRPARSKFFIVV